MGEEGNHKVKLKRNVFTPEEDVRLHNLVMAYSEDWKTISSLMGTRSPRQCRERYINYLAPGLANDKWTPQEDQLLIEKQKLFGKKWIHIAQFFPRRSSANIKNRWSQLVSKGLAFAQHFHIGPPKPNDASEPEVPKQELVQKPPEEEKKVEKTTPRLFSLPSIHEFASGNAISNLFNRSILRTSFFSGNKQIEPQLLTEQPEIDDNSKDKSVQRLHNFKGFTGLLW
ncbi:Myb-like DNA-binding domain containing protein [Trichomonas vaginalis G3]|uniref:Myb-like DNA-binding domain containing protein n=1 Tax=Trichomonas vaginalis (strain ATCC PRA-98 / G3) TaxID=412133 RepID=A2EKP5_TRIV3|nr:RNA polymerase II transcription regulator recruiting protein [Trichomonas vaginalis G3]EAY06784.1 Myb-like DNA-binding domain containing protein [Trichomonas vaginalis G3]KAI5485855.1 RNA polymerase II transcription regulator recruiting protein [Trichomonas vaginalis G3]|eukprot:XP_001319007.1 Myb-like DNA-binding domain containing protein [Trichomonas vaginalis G3]